VGSLSVGIGLVCWVGPRSSSTSLSVGLGRTVLRLIVVVVLYSSSTSSSCWVGSHPPPPRRRCGVSLLLVVVVVLGAALLLLRALCCTALFVLMLGWVALVVAVVAVLDALVQLTVGVVLGVWLSLLGHTCRLEAVCYIGERYLSFYHATCRRRVVFVVDGRWDVDRLCVVDGVCCRSGVCCTKPPTSLWKGEGQLWVRFALHLLGR